MNRSLGRSHEDQLTKQWRTPCAIGHHGAPVSTADRAENHDGGMTSLQTAFRTCPLCEAGCGLEITLDSDHVKRIRGDRDDVFSHGFICPRDRR